MYLLGVPVITIMSISGHKTEKSFRSYIKASPEEHARIMKEFWDKHPVSGQENTSIQSPPISETRAPFRAPN
jgi:hypothetical protein